MKKKGWITAGMVLLFSAAAGQSPFGPARGQVSENVSCDQFPGQSYALYLPRRYDPQKAWPALYCFDPGARGGLAVALFREAAEELGVIVIGSNNSRNGVPYAPACRAVWLDSRARFRISDRAVLAAGFSGGAHVAFSFGQAVNARVSGIIACSNGLPPWLTPESLPPPVAVFLFAGREDFNNQRTKNLEPAFSRLGIWSHAEIFSGGHEWPPAPLAAAALQAVCLRLMKEGALDREEALIDSLWARFQEAAQAAPDDLAACLAFRRAARTFAQIRDTTAVAARAHYLAGAAAVKEYEAANSRADRREDELLARIKPAYLGLFGGETNTLETGLGIRALGIERLLANSRSQKQSPEKIASKRVIEELFVTASVDGSRFFESREFSDAETAFEITHRIRPADWRPFFNLAAVAASRGETKRALKLLRSAVENGLDDPAAMESRLLDPLKKEDAFAELIQQVRLKNTVRKE